MIEQALLSIRKDLLVRRHVALQGHTEMAQRFVHLPRLAVQYREFEMKLAMAIEGESLLEGSDCIGELASTFIGLC